MHNRFRKAKKSSIRTSTSEGNGNNKTSTDISSAIEAADLVFFRYQDSLLLFMHIEVGTRVNLLSFLYFEKPMY